MNKLCTVFTFAGVCSVNKLSRVVVFAALSSVAFAAEAAVELASPFRDGMVLQRELPVNVWGTASASQSVTVNFAGVSVTTNADENGKWLVTLPAMPASREPRTLTAGDASIDDVLVGEVWIASGQSNMVMPLDGTINRFRDQDGLLMAQRTRRLDVRLMTTPEGVSATEQSKWGSHTVTWESVSPDNTAQRTFSAIGWRFAVGLRDALDVPVGVIFSAVNGTHIEGWIPANGYAAVGLDPTDETQVRNRGGYATPMCLWNGKVCPLAPMTVRGFLWYQGESNCGYYTPGGIIQYAQLLKGLYEGWRARFGNPELKLVVAGLASWGYGNEWLMNREQQRFVDSEPNASMAVINDIGIIGDIHGSDKARTAERMLALALKHAYDLPVKADAPVFKSAVANGSTVTVGFKNVERLRLWSCHETALTSHFELAGSDNKFYDATIENFEVITNKNGETRLTIGNIVGDTIRLSSTNVAAPKYVRYLYKNQLGNIFNEASLPLAAFSAEIDAAETFELTQDATIDVPAGTVKRLGVIGGGDYTLTKTGEGELVLTGATNHNVRVVVSAGKVSVGEIAAPNVLRDARFHVDAACAASLTFTAANGTNYVSRWDDCRTASLEKLEETHLYASCPDQYMPYIRKGMLNGRDIMDFGSLHPFGTAAKDPITGGRNGWGGHLNWSTEVTNILDVFTVVCEDPELKYANNRNPVSSQYLAPPFVGDCMTQASFRYNWMRDFLTGNDYTYYNTNRIQNALLLRPDFTDQYTDWVMKGNIYLDGGRTAGDTHCPDGFHLLEFQPTKDCCGSAFAAMGGHCQGGQRIAEFVVFERRLSEAERMLVQNYLMAKWLPVRIRSLTLAAGTTLNLPEHTSLEAQTLTMDETARVTGDGTLTAGVTDTIRPAGAVSLAGNGDEATSRYAFEGDAVVNVPSKVRTDLVEGDGALVKEGAGELTVVDLGAKITALDVREGEFRMRPLLNRRALLHVDASMPDTSSAQYVNSTNFVTTWVDVNHNDLRAYSSDGNKPFRRRAFQNGRDIIDLGSLKNSAINNPAGYGAAFDWKPGSVTNIREVFTVASDTPDYWEIVEKYGTKKQILTMYFVGESLNDSTKWQFIRPMFYGLAAGHTTTLIRDLALSKPVTDGTTLFDGVSVNPTAFEMQPGFHVINFQTVSDCYGDSFGKASGQSTGGQRIGEFMIFTNTLDAVTRAKINGTLMGKWLDSTNVYYWAFNNVSVAPGATADFEGQGLDVSGALAIAGTLKAQCVRASSLLLGADGETDAALVMTDGITVHLAAAPSGDFGILKAKKFVFEGAGTLSVSYPRLDELILGKRVLVMTADAIEGDLSKWKLDAGQKQLFSAALVRGDDGKSVYAVFGKRGLSLVFYCDMPFFRN